MENSIKFLIPAIVCIAVSIVCAFITLFHEPIRNLTRNNENDKNNENLYYIIPLSICLICLVAAILLIIYSKIIIV